VEPKTSRRAQFAQGGRLAKRHWPRRRSGTTIARLQLNSGTLSATRDGTPNLLEAGHLLSPALSETPPGNEFRADDRLQGQNSKTDVMSGLPTRTKPLARRTLPRCGAISGGG